MIAWTTRIAGAVIAVLLARAEIAQAQAPSGPGTGRRVQIGGYGEMHGMWREGEGEIALDRFVLFVGHEFSETVRMYSEVEIEDAHEVEMEQAYVEFVLSPTVAAEAGLVLVPLSRINLLHEPPTFLTARRPQLDRVIVPTTWREMGAGLVWRPNETMTLSAYALNGLDAHYFTASSAIRGGRQGGGESTARNLAGAARAVYSPALGATVAFAGYRGGANQGDDALDGVVVSLLSADAEIARSNVICRAAGAWGAIERAHLIYDATEEPVGSRFRGVGAEIGYSIAAGDARLTPFARWEVVRPQADLPDGVPGVPAEATVRWIGGASLRPTASVALKANVVRSSQAGQTETSVETALGFMF
jgi:hypothetical protein